MAFGEINEISTYNPTSNVASFSSIYIFNSRTKKSWTFFDGEEQVALE